MKDERGRFATGNTAGVQFSSENQPANRGRKPSRFKQIFEDLEDITGEAMSLEDYRKLTKYLLSLTFKELREIKDKDTSPVVVVLIATAIAGDIKHKQVTNIDKLLDRVFGKTIQTITPKDETVHQQVTIIKTYATDYKTDTSV